MERTNFENLQVYKLAEELADTVWEIVSKWNNFDRDTVGRQLVRSADSVGANIAEGAGRKTYTDNKRFVYMARGSSYETKHWLRRAYRRKLLTDIEIEKLKPILDALPPKLNAFAKSIGRSNGILRKDATND